MEENKRTAFTLEFQLSDAPAILHAFAIAANTAKLCGHPGAEQRLRQYQAMLAQYVPEAARLFDEEVWCEIGIALAQAQSFRVTLDRDRSFSWRTAGRPLVWIDDRRFRAHWVQPMEFDDPRLTALYDTLADLAPLGVEGVLETAYAKEEAR